MHFRVFVLVFSMALVLAASAPASAQTVPTIITIDENNPIVSLLPFSVTPGPLFLCETATTPGGCISNADISDELSFVLQTSGATSATAMCLFSDPDPSFGQTGPPEFTGTCPGSGLQANFASMLETRNSSGTETMLYIPTSGQAGFGLDSNGNPIEYMITSDSSVESDVPEPASLTLLGLGSGILGVARFLRRRVR